MKPMKFSAGLLVALVLMVTLAVPVWAAAPPTNGNIVNFGDTEVPLEAAAKNVLVIGGNTIIEGTIRDEVVVINGNLTLKSTASVHDHAIVLGGNLLTEDGAYVGKGVFRIGGDFAFAGTLVAAGAVIMGLWIINLVITAIVAIWPCIMAWVWRSGVEEASYLIRDNLLRTIVVGGLGIMTMLVLIVLLTVTVIGIPAAALVVIVTIGMLAAGMGGACHAMGQCLPLFPQQEKAGVIRTTFAGAILAALLFNVPVVGFLALLLISALSFGAMLMKVFKKKVA